MLNRTSLRNEAISARQLHLAWLMSKCRDCFVPRNDVVLYFYSVFKNSVNSLPLVGVVTNKHRHACLMR